MKTTLEIAEDLDRLANSQPICWGYSDYVTGQDDGIRRAQEEIHIYALGLRLTASVTMADNLGTGTAAPKGPLSGAGPEGE